MVAKRPPMKDLWDSADKVLISLLLCLTAFSYLESVPYLLLTTLLKITENVSVNII